MNLKLYKLDRKIQDDFNYGQMLPFGWSYRVKTKPREEWEWPEPQERIGKEKPGDEPGGTAGQWRWGQH